MKNCKIFLFAILVVVGLSCKKNNPIEEIGALGGGHKAQLSVSLSNRTPALGDIVVVTATTSHKSDKITKVEFSHTLSERFGIYLSLDNTVINTWHDTNPILIVRDTIVNNDIWKTVSSGAADDLENYYRTNENYFVIPARYTLFAQRAGKYDLAGPGLLLQLPDEAFEILKSQLARTIKVSEYARLFPTAPDGNYVMTAGTKTAISAIGKAFLRSNLSKQNLIDNGLKEIHKEGVMAASVNVRVTTENGIIKETSNSFESAYQ
ncbi:hypothetical protein [Desertivirga xinjiangensis]|uniref:hypothetical protein n=1 Tax=Desertivirga xinjiangensis TaxID=539206 RepID=UPI0021087EE1|nr:hypothetical protein [Pedobacter xinjiangensis]